jgi:hypothetical protein
VEEELKEYEKKKSELKSAIKANNFKLDDAYKQELSNRAKTAHDSVKEGLKFPSSGGLAEKRDKKKHSIASDLDNFVRPAMRSELDSLKREPVQDLQSLFAEIGPKRPKAE